MNRIDTFEAKVRDAIAFAKSQRWRIVKERVLLRTPTVRCCPMVAVYLHSLKPAAREKLLHPASTDFPGFGKVGRLLKIKPLILTFFTAGFDNDKASVVGEWLDLTKKEVAFGHELFALGEKLRKELRPRSS